MFFFGQPVFGPLIKSLDYDKIVEMIRKIGAEKHEVCKAFRRTASKCILLKAAESPQKEENF